MIWTRRPKRDRELAKAERLARRHGCLVVADRDLSAAALQVQRLHLLVESSGYLAGKGAVRKKLRAFCEDIWQHLTNARTNGRPHDAPHTLSSLSSSAEGVPTDVHARAGHEGRQASAG